MSSQDIGLHSYHPHLLKKSRNSIKNAAFHEMAILKMHHSQGQGEKKDANPKTMNALYGIMINITQCTFTRHQPANLGSDESREEIRVING